LWLYVTAKNKGSVLRARIKAKAESKNLKLRIKAMFSR
jgi:hypothetical protein